LKVLPGQYYDAETNLHYNYFRYYDPSIGRYITSDPIGLSGGNNTYGYVLQNPILLIDLRGDEPERGNSRGDVNENSVDPNNPDCEMKCFEERSFDCFIGVSGSCVASCVVLTTTGVGGAVCAGACTCLLGPACFEIVRRNCRFECGNERSSDPFR
jgi:RHS repeat-associated protein